MVQATPRLLFEGNERSHGEISASCTYLTLQRIQARLSGRGLAAKAIKLAHN